MIDYQGALEKAIYTRLSRRVTKATVFQHVPESSPPPVVILGDVDCENEGEKDSPLFRFTVQVMSIVQGPGRKPLNALQAEVFAALDGWKPAATADVTFGEVSIGTVSGQEIQAAQGPVYYGQQTATVYVQAA